MKSDFVGMGEADLISSEAPSQRFHPNLFGFHPASAGFHFYKLQGTENGTKQACRPVDSLSNQLERSGTSIVANIREAKYAHSKADFIAKLQISLKECY